MKNILIEKIKGKWYFNGQLYVELGGIEKRFVDDMLSEVKLHNLTSPRTKNPNLKDYNHNFKFSH